MKQQFAITTVSDVSSDNTEFRLFCKMDMYNEHGQIIDIIEYRQSFHVEFNRDVAESLMVDGAIECFKLHLLEHYRKYAPSMLIEPFDFDLSTFPF